MPAYPVTVAAYLVTCADTLTSDGGRAYAPATLAHHVAAFARDYGAKYPKAVAKIVDDVDVLLGVGRALHLGTTNPIESTFATVHLRTKVTKGPESQAAGMAYKLIEAAQAR